MEMQQYVPLALLTGYKILGTAVNTLRRGDADLRFYITTVQDG